MIRLAVLAALVLAGVALAWQEHPDAPLASQPALVDEVAIDDGPTGYTLVVGLPRGEAGQAARREALQAGGRVVSLAALTAAPLRHLGGAIERDDYGLRARLPRLIALVARSPGQRFGITWNGGLTRSADLLKLAARRRVADRAPSGAPRAGRGDPFDPVHLLP